MLFVFFLDETLPVKVVVNIKDVFLNGSRLDKCTAADGEYISTDF